MSRAKGVTALKTQSVGLRSRAWWLMRKHRQLTIADMMQSICDGTEGNAETNLRCWSGYLLKVGIFDRVLINDGKLTSNGSYLYRLINDLGPKAPVIQRKALIVYDPNSGKSFPLPPVINRSRRGL